MVRLIEGSDGEGELFGFLCDLLLADWESQVGPLRLSTDLNLADLTGVRFFSNAWIFLTALAENDGAPTTAAGNLSRVFVGQMFDRMKLPAAGRESMRRHNKVLDEEDLWLLQLVRVVSQCARLIARRKRRFRLSKDGRALLPEEQAGVFYRALFVAYFRRFDLRYLQVRDVPGIQDTAAVILWRLDAVAQEWMPVRALAPSILLPRGSPSFAPRWSPATIPRVGF